MWNIYEHPWTLLIVAFVVLLALLIFRMILPKKRRWWHWLLPLAVAAAAFAVDYFVKTDLEKIKTIIETATKAVVNENADALEPLFADNYRDSYHLNKNQLMANCRVRFSEPLVDKAVTRFVSIDITGQQAIAIFTVRILFDPRSFIYQEYKSPMMVKVELDLQKQQDHRWLITRTEILEINKQPTKWEDISQGL